MKPRLLSLIVVLLLLSSCKQVKLSRYDHSPLSVATADNRETLTPMEKIEAGSIERLPERVPATGVELPFIITKPTSKPSPPLYTTIAETDPQPSDDDKPKKPNDDVFWAAFTSLMFTLLTGVIILFAPGDIPISYVAVFISGVLALVFGISALNRRKPGMKNYKAMAILAGILGAISMFVGFYFFLALI